MGQLKKNEYRKYFFAAVGVAIIVFACVGVIMLNYSITVKRELYLKPLIYAGWTGIAKNITSSLPGSEPSTTTFFLSITRLFHVFPSSRYPFLPDDDK